MTSILPRYIDYGCLPSIVVIGNCRCTGEVPMRCYARCSPTTCRAFRSSFQSIDVEPVPVALFWQYVTQTLTIRRLPTVASNLPSLPTSPSYFSTFPLQAQRKAHQIIFISTASRMLSTAVIFWSMHRSVNQIVVLPPQKKTPLVTSTDNGGD